MLTGRYSVIARRCFIVGNHSESFPSASLKSPSMRSTHHSPNLILEKGGCAAKLCAILWFALVVF